MADDNLMGKLGKSVSGIQTEEEQSQQDQYANGMRKSWFSEVILDQKYSKMTKQSAPSLGIAWWC